MTYEFFKNKASFLTGSFFAQEKVICFIRKLKFVS